MQAVGVLAHVDRAYQASSAYQWAREAVVNAIQARATQVTFGVEWQAVAARQVYRRTIIDNGSGIPAQQMPAFLNKFGGSGRIIGDITSNYGIGFKTSCLPWNTAGVVVISVNSESENSKSRVNMMWLRREKRSDGTFDYGARELLPEFFDDGSDAYEEFTGEWCKFDDATTVLPLSLLKEKGFKTVIEGIDWLKVVPKKMIEDGHGTVIVLLGNKQTEHTVYGDQSRSEGESKYGLQRYLNTRFYSLPEGVNVGVVTLGSSEEGRGWGDPKHWPRSPKGAGASAGLRMIVGMRACLGGYMEKYDGETLYERITLDKGKGVPVPVAIDTYLFPDAEQSPNSTGGYNNYMAGTWPSLPLIAYVLKCHEEIDLYETFAVRTMAEGKTALHPWVNLDNIRRRMALILHPTDTEDVRVFPDQTRRSLLYQSKTKGGTPLPEEEWAEAFRTARPAFISQEINKFFSKLNAEAAEMDAALIEKLGVQYGMFFAMTVIEKRRGKKVKEPEETVDDGRGRGGAREASVKSRSGRDVIVKRGLLDVKITELESGFPVELNTDSASGKPIGLVDIRHALIQDAWAMCLMRLKAEDVNDDTEIESYYKAFKGQVVAHVALALTHLWAFLKAGNMSLREEMTTPAALANIVTGIRHFQQASQGPFGTIKAGRKPKAS